jgi:hypothetical protein
VDIVVCASNNHCWGVLFNLGSGFLSSPEYHNVNGYYPNAIATGDLNGDGRDDVVVAGQSTEVWYSFSWGYQVVVLETNSYKEMAAVTDFDGDGDQDVLTATYLYQLVMYENQGDTSLHRLPEINTVISASSFLISDFNNDLLPDIAFLSLFPDTIGTGIPDTVGGIYIFHNQGGFQLSPPQFLPLTNVGEGWRQFTSADLDGNGYNDFAVVRTLYIPLPGNLELLFNDGNGNFSGTPVGIVEASKPSEKVSLTCYPNPISTKGVIKYNLDFSAEIDLRLYDMQGKEIKCLANGMMTAGSYSIQIEVSDFQNNNVMMACLKVNGKYCHNFKLVKL